MRRGWLRFKNGMSKVLNAALVVLVAALVVDVVWGVFTRYMLGEQAQWTEELARFLLVWVSLLGAASAFETQGHLGVDYFVRKFHPDVQKVLAMVSQTIILLFAVVVFLYGGGRVVADALFIEQATPALGWKMGYIYLALPIAGCFMAIHTVENLTRVYLGESGESEMEEGEP